MTHSQSDKNNREVEPGVLDGLVVHGREDREQMAKAWKARVLDRIYVDEEVKAVVINLAYPYYIDLGRIRDKADLLEWVHHLSKKSWMKDNPGDWGCRLAVFIEVVCNRKGWSIYRGA